MRFTVVIPARNEELGIATCIASVVSAARRVGTTVDILVVDDGSSDGTAARAEASGARVIRHVARRGPLAAWASGVDGSNTEVIVFVDADCTLDEGALALLLGAIEEPGVGVVSGRAVPVDGARVGKRGSPSAVVRRSGKFSAVLLDEIKGRVGDHDFIAIGRLMAVRRAAWHVSNTALPHGDRQVTSAARRGGWRAVWVPEARVYYRTPTSFSELRSDWRRTRLALAGWAQAFAPIPWRLEVAAASASLRRAPLDGLCWLICRARLVCERRRRCDWAENHQPVAWD